MNKLRSRSKPLRELIKTLRQMIRHLGHDPTGKDTFEEKCLFFKAITECPAWGKRTGPVKCEKLTITFSKKYSKPSFWDDLNNT